MNLISEKYINRELSWLEFNQRVLDEALIESMPLLERLKFIAITASNLDEFFMVRVGGLQLLREDKSDSRDPSGATPEQQLKAIGHRTSQMVNDMYTCFNQQIEPALNEAGIHRITREKLNTTRTTSLQRFFLDEVSSVLSPVAVDDEHPFPFLTNQTLSIFFRLAIEPSKNRTLGPAFAEEQTERYVVIPLGKVLSRFLTIPSEGGYNYVLLEDAVIHFAGHFFPEQTVLEAVTFRITRNADMAVREDDAADLAAGMEKVLDWRKDSNCVRLEIDGGCSQTTLEFLTTALAVDNDNIYQASGPLDMAAFFSLASLHGFDELRNKTWVAQPSSTIDPKESMFENISQQDHLLYHPYESFDPVVRLINEAADDPDVLAIKQTLYRTSRNSPIIAALIRAASNGKHVTTLVELKARFDEARNIGWARNLEQAGAQVIYGVRGLKTHSKICVIVRREPHGIRRYMHFGTGNYNEVTAHIYSDVSLLTCDEDLGSDAINFFNAITGYSQPQKFQKLEMAPHGLREKLHELVDGERTRALSGEPAEIVIKVNSLVDPQLIDALYAASQAGVKIRLNVRGICCLRPGVAGLSENITVISVVDRYLEHARIFYFLHGGDERLFISSADWMRRNLDNRVELLVPVENHSARNRLIKILDMYFQDNVKSHRLDAEGSYHRLQPNGKSDEFSSQKELFQLACRFVNEAKQTKLTEFQPYRNPNHVN